MSDASHETRVGLCADCQHARQIESARGSTFYLCKRSETDPNYPRYPRLPVLECAGYESVISESDEARRLL